MLHTLFEHVNTSILPSQASVCLLFPSKVGVLWVYRFGLLQHLSERPFTNNTMQLHSPTHTHNQIQVRTYAQVQSHRFRQTDGQTCVHGPSRHVGHLFLFAGPLTKPLRHSRGWTASAAIMEWASARVPPTPIFGGRIYIYLQQQEPGKNQGDCKKHGFWWKNQVFDDLEISDGRGGCWKGLRRVLRDHARQRNGTS